MTYGQIAKAVGAAPQAVGQACGRELLADHHPLPSRDGDRLVRRIPAPAVETKSSIVATRGGAVDLGGMPDLPAGREERRLRGTNFKERIR